MRRSGRPSWLLALLAGFPHQSALTASLRSGEISATPLVVARLQRLAQEINFPPDEIFVGDTEMVR